MIRKEIRQQTLDCNQYLETHIKVSFREIMKPMAHHRAVYQVMIQQKAYVNKQLKEGQVEKKAADYVMAEIDSKMMKLKTVSIQVEDLPTKERIEKNMTLLSIFGKEFTRELAQKYEQQTELQFAPN